MQWLLTCIENYRLPLFLVVISIAVFALVFLVMKSRYPYKSAKKHGFTIAGIALFIAIIYAIEQYAHFKDIKSWIGIADNILSGAIFAIFCVLFLGIEKRIKNRFEDAEKLRQDYNALAEKYKKNNLVKAVNQDGSIISYPVIHLGTGFISLRKDENEQVTIDDSPNEHYRLPAIMENYYADVFSVHDTSNIYNNLNIRVKSMKLENNTLLMSAMRTTYYDSLVTNRAADYEFSEGLSVRELFETGPKMTSLENSRLSNHLGFNGFVESSDGYIVFVKRSDDMSIGKRTYGDSIAASLKTKYALDNDGNFTYQGLRDAIICEIYDELKINRDCINLDTLGIIAAYRDCVECGKPQLLIYGKSAMNAKQISTNFTTQRKEKLKKIKKLNKKQRQELEMLEDGTKLVWITRQALLEDIVYHYAQLEIQSTEKEGFICFNEHGRKSAGIRAMEMVPSASASVFLLKEALLKSPIKEVLLDSPKIIEAYICSKYQDQGLCEDGLIVTSNVIVVIDGGTAKGKLKWDGKSSGKYAMEIIRKALEKGVTTQSPLEFFTALNQALKEAIRRHPNCDTKDKPRAAVIAYIADKRQIWSYGDCRCIVGNEYFSHEKKIDILLSNKRAGVIEEQLANQNVSFAELQQHDIGRDAVMDDLTHQFEYENKHCLVNGLDYGYPILNGESICEDMIIIHEVPKGIEVVLASDGYPILKRTLHDSEVELARIIKTDPLCYKEYKSTKGVTTGCLSFDDRTYIRFET